MNWQTLFSNKRLGAEHRNAHENFRTDYMRDYDRLIFSSQFRRLQNKTQVFPLPGAVFVHNRLTHSLEVASVGAFVGEKQLVKESLKIRKRIESRGHLSFIKLELSAGGYDGLYCTRYWQSAFWTFG